MLHRTTVSSSRHFTTRFTSFPFLLPSPAILPLLLLSFDPSLLFTLQLDLFFGLQGFAKLDIKRKTGFG